MRLLHRLLGADWRAALPSQCRVCHAWPAPTLCVRCVTRFAPTQPRCERCALPVPPGVRVCGACLREPPPVDTCLAALPYAWPWTDVMAHFKFYAEPGLAAPLGALLHTAPGVADAVRAADLVLPLPLSAERVAERGYNPAQLLGERLVSNQRGAHSSALRLDLLLRTRHTPPQHELPRAERLRNVRGAYAVDPLRATAIAGSRVLLVDDVMTTGASLFEAARAVRSAGAVHITAVALARTDWH